MALARLQPLAVSHRVQAAGDDEPIPFNHVGDDGRIRPWSRPGCRGTPPLRLPAGRLIEFAHDANRRLLDRANFWRALSASSVLWCCALWHRAINRRTRSPVLRQLWPSDCFPRPMPSLPYRRPFHVGQPFKPMDSNLFHIGSVPLPLLSRPRPCSGAVACGGAWPHRPCRR
jgi:hypothetical protein